jgi:hypothetical protein
MSKLSHAALHARIALVERRLQRRRARMLEDAIETASAARQTATKFVPIGAALGAGLLALYLMRGRSNTPRYSAYRAQYQNPPARRAVRWAQLVGVIGSAIRIGTSPQLRAFWHGYRRARERRRY